VSTEGQQQQGQPGQPPIRIMIVDDHAVVRDGLEAVIAREPDMTVIASVGSGAEALAQVDAARPDVVLLDLRMPEMDGLRTLEALCKGRPQLRVVMLSGQTGDEAIFQALSRGAVGYLAKSAASAEMLDGIRQAMRGRLRPSAEVAALLAERSFHEKLSDREIQVLKHAADGQSNKEIAVALGLAENTVKNHIKNIMVKLDAADRTEAVTLALRRGIFDLGDLDR
jgi:DNA-binding NarL/FixJ family response regulator